MFNEPLMLSPVLTHLFSIVIVAIIFLAELFLHVHTVSDDISKNKNFLGISSMYLVNFSVCVLFLDFIILIGNIISNSEISAPSYLCGYLCITCSIYNMSIFLIKKYIFNNMKKEAGITLLLFLFEIITIILASIIYSSNILPTINIFNSNSYYLTMFVRGFTFSMNDWLSTLFVLLMIFPYIVLFLLWYKSVTKKYDAKDLDYFTKNTNKPIILFSIYVLLFFILQITDISNNVLLGIYFIFIVFIKIQFYKSLITFLKEKDNERELKIQEAKGKVYTRGFKNVYFNVSD